MPKINSDRLLEALAVWGIDVASTRRVVIDIRWDCMPIVHVESIGDDRLLSVVQALGGVEIKRESKE
jgi:hypothetical protein